MPVIDPVARFWIGVAITIAVGISQGALNLAHAIPSAWIPYVDAWAGIIAFVGSAILTALNGAASTTTSRLASAASVPLPQKLDALVANHPEIKSVVTTAEVANATTSEKVVTK